MELASVEPGFVHYLPLSISISSSISISFLPSGQ